MIGGLALGFGAPAVLAGLLALPVIWWLLRMTPPKPQQEMFPPLRILARIMQKEETPHKSPWWLTLLRLVLATLVILALARPLLNPQSPVGGSGALALVMDNSWASSSDWDKRVSTATRLIEEAGSNGQTVVLAFTAEPEQSEIGPFQAGAALDRLRAAKPQPVPPRRSETYARVAETLRIAPAETLALLTDGLSASDEDSGFSALMDIGAKRLIWGETDLTGLVGLNGVENRPNAFEIKAIRPNGSALPQSHLVTARDEKGRQIAEATLTFAAGESSASIELAAPFELRNEFASIQLEGIEQAAAVRLIDDNDRRRRIALISASEADQAQPLLSPLFYIKRALEPFADLIEPRDADLANAIPEILEERPAVVVMADVGKMPESASESLEEWIRGGGTLIRFAGPRLAAAAEEDELLPVMLRAGERALGGALSWTEPQPVAEFPPTGPFSDLTPPRDVSVTRQVLAEPGPDIAEKTWANLADGTPLVTGSTLGRGTIALFHVTPEATWSNLPISGSFVDMLRRIIQLSSNQGQADTAAAQQSANLPPFRIIDASGIAGPPPPSAKPLTGDGLVTIANPPGLYGSQEGVIAHDLLNPDTKFSTLTAPDFGVPVTGIAYAFDETIELAGWLFGAALVLLAIDTLITFWIAGVFQRRPNFAPKAAANASYVLAAALVLAAAFPIPGNAADDRPGDDDIIDAITKTRIAYVITGNRELDRITESGLRGLTNFLIARTALEPGEPKGVDLETDELAFYPIIYWALDENSPAPGEQAVAKLDAYMQKGGTVLFDTRDQFSSGFSDSSASGENRLLRDILDGLNIPPLEPVPPDHVLTKSFFILNDFPGRYNGSPLWVEASLTAQNADSRPVRTGDGVSPIMITGNDFAGAWATDTDGRALLPTVPNNPLQRVYAYRAGVNIMMYMLTGNYKSDQVHIPALLERLGN